MNKIVKGLAIATVTVLGANFVLKRLNKLNQPKKLTESEEDYFTVDGQRFITPHGIYNDVMNGRINPISKQNEEKVSGFPNIPGRKYHTLNFPNSEETKENEEAKGRTM